MGGISIQAGNFFRSPLQFGEPARHFKTGRQNLVVEPLQLHDVLLVRRGAVIFIHDRFRVAIEVGGLHFQQRRSGFRRESYQSGSEARRFTGDSDSAAGRGQSVGGNSHDGGNRLRSRLGECPDIVERQGRRAGRRGEHEGRFSNDGGLVGAGRGGGVGYFKIAVELRIQLIVAIEAVHQGGEIAGGIPEIHLGFVAIEQGGLNGSGLAALTKAGRHRVRELAERELGNRIGPVHILGRVVKPTIGCFERPVAEGVRIDRFAECHRHRAVGVDDG